MNKKNLFKYSDNRFEREQLFEEILNETEQTEEIFFQKFSHLGFKLVEIIGEIDTNIILKESNEENARIANICFDRLRNLIDSFTHFKFNQEKLKLDFKRFESYVKNIYNLLLRQINDLSIKNIIENGDEIDTSPYIKEIIKKYELLVEKLNKQLEQFEVNIKLGEDNV